MELQDVVGKTFKYKFLDEEPKTVESHDNKFYYFDDGSAVPIEKLNQLFEMTNYNANQARKILLEESNGTPAQTQPTQNGGWHNQEQIDPDEFFNRGLNSAQQIFTEEASKVNLNEIKEDFNAQNPPQQHQPQQPINTNEDTVLEYDEGAIARGELSEETRRLLENGGKPIQQPDNFDITGMNKTQPQNPNTASGNVGQAPVPRQPQPVAQQNVVQPPQMQLFNKVKKVKDLKIKIVHETKIPNLDILRMLDQNFEEGVLDNLVDEIAFEILHNPLTVKKIVKEQLEKLVYPSKAKKTKAKTRRRKPAAKKPTVESNANEPKTDS